VLIGGHPKTSLDAGTAPERGQQPAQIVRVHRDIEEHQDMKVRVPAVVPVRDLQGANLADVTGGCKDSLHGPTTTVEVTSSRRKLGEELTDLVPGLVRDSQGHEVNMGTSSASVSKSGLKFFPALLSDASGTDRTHPDGPAASDVTEVSHALSIQLEGNRGVFVAALLAADTDPLSSRKGV
jgi:hypothetical protein